MTPPLLTTKLYIPSTRPELVSRPRLIGRLNEGLRSGKFTLISAPAGFGKTTLVSAWVDHLRLEATKESPTKNRIAWLSLDESDNDLTRFLSYFIAALRTIEARQESVSRSSLMSSTSAASIANCGVGCPDCLLNWCSPNRDCVSFTPGICLPAVSITRLMLPLVLFELLLGFYLAVFGMKEEIA